MSITRYSAGRLTPIVSIAGSGRLEAALDRIMIGWRLEPAPAPALAQDGALSLHVEERPEGWRCSGAGFEEPVTYGDPVSAACGLIAGLFKAHTFGDPDGLCLHAAGVRFGEGIVLLTGDYRAGKSLLTAACCAAGAQVYSDDIIPLVPGQPVARAPGLGLRLRLPLPESLDAGTRSFLAEHSAVEGDRYLYVRPPETRLAPYGSEGLIRAIVSIERTAGASARLARLAPGDALAEMIRRNFAREIPARRIIDALDRLVTGVPILRLSYADAAGAAALMQRVFSGGMKVAEADGSAPGLPARSARGRQARGRPAAAIPEGSPVRRSPGVGMHERGGEVFLTDPEDMAIYSMNATGAALWRLIEDPIPFAEIVETFSAAFPDRSRRALSGDLAGLILDLVAKGLVRLDIERGAVGGEQVAAEYPR